MSRTPELVTELLREFVPGEPPALSTFPAVGADAVILRGLPFHSLCAHHLLPFFGEADVAYLPGDRIAGLGGIPRLLEHCARRPQLQERLGGCLADLLEEALEPRGLVIRLRARQLCMEMRGARSPGTVEVVVQRGAAAAALVALLLSR
ncbi:MAG: GTP cyclohydrolase I [Deltaproteobacteria bacterium]|nr:GTP cyclohydrolase I [Deltaproteobacteria bacterium]